MEHLDLERKINTYVKQGWHPVKWAHHPKPIKNALRAIGLRPKMKECYGNCQRLLISGHPIADELIYIEGYVTSILPVPHAWLLYQGEILDLTLRADACTYPDFVMMYSHEQVWHAVRTHMYFGSVSECALFYTSPYVASLALLHGVDSQPGVDHRKHHEHRLKQMREDGLTEEQITYLMDHLKKSMEASRD